ncbi:MAG: hypothetical protein ACLTXM_14885 [Enterococcus sp.]
MKSNLTATERVHLEKELNDLMMFADKNDSDETINKRYKRAGELMTQLNLLDPTHQNIPEVIVRVYAHYTRSKIERIVNKTHY